MNTQILEYRKTDHFLLSQWDRKIDDDMLYKILPFIECVECEKDIILIMPSFLIKKRMQKDHKQCLILIIKEKRLITSFWCDHPNYLFKNEKNTHFQILY